MARPSTPTAILELRGAFKNHPGRKRPQEPKPDGPLGSPPRHLNKEQRKIWRELTSWAPQGVFTGADRPVVEMASVLFWNFRRWQRGEIEFFGAQNWSRMHALLGSFGMTPADRSRVALAKPDKPADPWADLANKAA